MIVFEVVPLRGVGPIAFGMTREAVRAAVVFPATEEPGPDGRPTDRYCGNLVVHYDADDRVERIEATGGGLANLEFEGQYVFLTGSQRVIEKVALWGAADSPAQDRSRDQFPSLGLSLVYAGESEARRRRIARIVLARPGAPAAEQQVAEEPAPRAEEQLETAASPEPVIAAAEPAAEAPAEASPEPPAPAIAQPVDDEPARIDAAEKAPRPKSKARSRRR
jgi:hypothetical protein